MPACEQGQVDNQTLSHHVACVVVFACVGALDSLVPAAAAADAVPVDKNWCWNDSTVGRFVDSRAVVVSNYQKVALFSFGNHDM